MPGDSQTRSGITPNAVSLNPEPMPLPELMGEPTLSCGSLTEAAIRNGVPGSSARATNRIKRPLPRQRIAWNLPRQESIS